MDAARTIASLAAGLAAVALPWAGLAAAAADGDTPSRCGDRPGRTLTERGAGRVLLARQEVRACVRGVARPDLIGGQWRPAVSSSGGGGVLRVAVDGTFVASSSENFSHGFDDVAFSVRDARRHRTTFLRFYPLGSVAGRARQAEAFDLVLCRGGRVAFLVGFRSDPSGPIESYEVRRSSGRHTVLLARSVDIEPGSLRATPGRITWRASGVKATAAAPCKAPSPSVAVPKLTVDEVFG